MELGRGYSFESKSNKILWGLVFVGFFSLLGCRESSKPLCKDNDAPSLAARVAIDGEYIKPGEGELSIQGEATILSSTGVYGPASISVEFEMKEDAMIVKTGTRFPPGVYNPFKVGDTVLLRVDLDANNLPGIRIQINKTTGELILLQYEGEFGGIPSDADCKPVEYSCGTQAYVPMSITFEDPTIEPQEQTMTLQPGERRTLDANGDVLVVQMGAPRVLVENLQCQQVNPSWVTYSIVRE